MSFLYPLFLAGIAAIGLPILLHMIRRHTRKKVAFSSLMFLHTTIPRFRNRSRPENLLLLILRCLIICLLAIAFARPFLEKPGEDTTVSLGRRIVLLIDTSASMQREGMWAQVVDETGSVLDDLEPTDRLCVISFDDTANSIIGFETWSELEPQQRLPFITEEISKLTPTWASTNLGNALVTASEAIEDDEINDKLLINERQIVLITDLQEGSNIDGLHTYEWPERTELIIKPITAKRTTNAAMQVLTTSNYISQSDPNDQLRVRIMNSADAITEQFTLSWADNDSIEDSNKSISVYVPPGQSIVTKLPPGPNEIAGRKLILTGDGHDFDNTLYIAPNLEQQINILYIGNDSAEDSKQMQYYIQRAFQKTDTLTFNIIHHSTETALTDSDVNNAHFIIVTDSLKSEQIKLLRQKIESGNTLILAMKSAETAATISNLAGIDRLDCKEANVEDYTMFGSIEFEHPILAPFSDPQFGNFSKIHFWKYRHVNLENIPQARILASFDNNDPALIELPVGQGSLLILASGWQPSDSQFALSSKFVPLLYSILEYNGVLGGKQSQYFVGDAIRIPQTLTSGTETIKIRKPDNSLIDLNSQQQVFEQTEQPGFYNVESASGNLLFAVNLPVQECRTAPLPIEDIERFGVAFADSSSKPSEQTKQVAANQTFVEMEYQQKFWRWLFIALFGLLIIEIWLGGWLTRPSILTQQGEDK